MADSQGVHPLTHMAAAVFRVLYLHSMALEKSWSFQDYQSGYGPFYRRYIIEVN